MLRSVKDLRTEIGTINSKAIHVIGQLRVHELNLQLSTFLFSLSDERLRPKRRRNKSISHSRHSHVFSAISYPGPGATQDTSPSDMANGVLYGMLARFPEVSITVCLLSDPMIRAEEDVDSGNDERAVRFLFPTRS